MKLQLVNRVLLLLVLLSCYKALIVFYPSFSPWDIWLLHKETNHTPGKKKGHILVGNVG